MSSELSTDPETDALIIVDVQMDFCSGGALPVPSGDEVIPVINEWLEGTFIRKIATRDWHPSDHGSFRDQGGPWPPHCVRNTEGAELHPGLNTDQVDRIVSKGTTVEEEGYSAFETGELGEDLRAHGISRLWTCGLATDYCVRESVLDACSLGYEVFVIDDAISGINAEPGDVQEAREEMKGAGARFVTTSQVFG